MQIIPSAIDIKKEIEDEDSVFCRIALFGRSGSGKSSLINRIIGKKVVETGIKTDTTRERADFQHGNLILSDLPGFNTQAFQAGEYLSKFKILEEFDLFLCILKDRIEYQDVELFKTLIQKKKPCIFIRNKEDEIWNEEIDKQQLMNDIRADFSKNIGLDSKELLFTSCKTGYGISELIHEIHQKAPETVKFQFVRSAKAYDFNFLNHKKEQVDSLVHKYALLSVANGINPIPGADIAVDISILMALFHKIKSIYGLNTETLHKFEKRLSGSSKALINNLIKYVTKEGIMILLKRFIGIEAGKGIGKYIPFVGQALAAGAGYYLTRKVGKEYALSAYKVAHEIMLLEESEQSNNSIQIY